MKMSDMLIEIGGSNIFHVSEQSRSCSVFTSKLKCEKIAHFKNGSLIFFL